MSRFIHRRRSQKGFTLIELLIVVAIMIPLTPVVMLSRLGWDKLVTERLVAFFTFELVAAAEIVLIALMLRRTAPAR